MTGEDAIPIIHHTDGLPLPQRNWAILTIGLGLVMAVIDGAIANVALPTIAGSQSSSFGGVKGRDQVPELVQLHLDGRLDIDPFISHRLALDEVNEGFALMERQDGIRSVLSFA